MSHTFRPQVYDYSPASMQLARDVAKEGDAKLADLERTIEDLRKHHQDLRLTIAQYKTFLAPISRLPEDVLLLIFATLIRATKGPADSLQRIIATSSRRRSTALSCSAL